MALAAAQVIDVLAARLAPMPATGGRVYTSRLWPLSEADLPAWRVTAEAESVEAATVDGLNEHRLTVQAKAVTRSVADLDDALHALAAAGLALLFAGTPPYGLQLDAIDRQLSTAGEAAVGEIALSMTALYFVAPATPETIYS